MTFPVVTVSVAFDTDPLAAPTWTSLGQARVLSFTTNHGRQRDPDTFQPGTITLQLKNQDRLFDTQYAAGTYYGKLKPRKRVRVQAVYAGTTYDLFYGFVDQWGPQRYAPPADAVVEVPATDWFVVLNEIELPAVPYDIAMGALTTRPKGYWKLTDTAGVESASDSSGNGYHGVYRSASDLTSVADGLVFGEPAQIFDGVADAVDILDYAVRVDTTETSPHKFAVMAWFRSTGTPASTEYDTIFNQSGSAIEDTMRLTVDDSTKVGFDTAHLGFGFYSDTNTTGWNDQAAHFVLALVDYVTPNFDIWVDNVNQAWTTSSQQSNSTTAVVIGGHPNPANNRDYFTGQIGHVAVFDGGFPSPAEGTALYEAGLGWIGDTTGERIGRILDYAGVLAGDRDIDTGLTTLGATTLGGSALAYCQSIETTEYGAFYVDHRNAGKITFRDRTKPLTATRSTTVQVTFSDDPTDGTAIRYEPDGLELVPDGGAVINEAVVQWDGGELRVSDATSRTTHGLKSKTFATRLKTAAEAQSYGEWIIAHFKDAVVRVGSITLNPAANNAAWPAALGLRRGDRVRFRFQPQALGTAISTDYLIEGISETVSSGVSEWQTTYYLSPAEIQTTWGIWDSGLWDTATWVM